MRFCLRMGGGGETTPLVCCLRCSVGFVGVSCIVGRVRALFLSLAFFLLPLLACVRTAVAGRVPACECGGSSHAHMPVSVWCVVVGGGGPCLSSRSPPTTRHQTGAGIDTHSAFRACTPPPSPARQSGGARRDCFLVTITITNHEHGAARPDGPQSRKQTLQQTQTRGASCAIGGARMDLAAVVTAFTGQPEVKSCCCCPPP